MVLPFPDGLDGCRSEGRISANDLGIGIGNLALAVDIHFRYHDSRDVSILGSRGGSRGIHRSYFPHYET